MMMNTVNKQTVKINNNELIDRYINAVGENLSQKSRADIAMELRSLIQDAIDERAANQGEQSINATTELTAEVLREFGDPKTIAARYRPAEVLIGADLFPNLPAGAHHHLVDCVRFSDVAPGLITGPAKGSSLFTTDPQLFGSVWESMLLNAAIVTVIFAVIERVSGVSWQTEAGKSAPSPKASWDPYQLPPIQDRDRLKHGDLIAGIVVCLFLIGGLNFFYDSIGYLDLDANSTRIYGILSEGFRLHVPWLMAAWALDILLKLLVLVQGRWNRLTRWLEVGGDFFGLFVLTRILTSDTIATIAIIMVIMVIVVIDLVRKLYRLLVQKPVSALHINTQFA
jgi:hypothetical protein